MNKISLINIGYDNYIAKNRIVSVIPPDSAPAKRLIQDAKADSKVIDSSSGKATKSVIVTDCEYVVLSALTPEQILHRFDEDDSNEEADLD